MYKVLFICRHNAGRSVIAESLAQHYLPNERFHIASGGVEPTGNINPLVKSYLEDNQLPIPHNHAHSWEERVGFEPDIVVTLCDSLQGEPTPRWMANGIRINWQIDAFPTGYHANKNSLYHHAALVTETLKPRILRMNEVLVDGLPSVLVSDYMKNLNH
ncbi:arsenate reductase/protein-tyrosine-phosphatase family protein [Vibrio agarivorans]|uniref:arsenate reductase/protein-tyrosine-phosphatase family protein n=1 Tax=Vibrio agarivorans TaxID=153622 RepID=UPI0022311306|nr:low molecular weight phosphatase family protein [Vibrio agarivorans]MDN3661517.1 low molecular weight phosphatase family protein [Vibrio agarivorans]